MEILYFFSALFCFFLLLIFIFKPFFLNPPKTHLPPPPPSPPFSLPILGHLHLLKKPLHRCLSHLSDRYGPILLLQFGSRTALVVSSPSALQQCFTDNDIVLANRPRLLAGKYLGYNYTTLAWASYGNGWRNLRRVTTIEIFSSNRVNASSAVRNEEVRTLVRKLCDGGRGGREIGFQKVELRQVFFELILNVMMRITAGKRYYGGGEQKADSGEARKFREIVEETFSVSAATNFLDFLPALRWVGFGGVEKRIKDLQKKRNEFLQDLIDERRRPKSRSGVNIGEVGEGEEKKKKTLLDAVLGLQESDPEYYTDEILKGIIVIMFTAGTDTTTLTMEWAMSLLLNHPEVLRKARREIDSHVKQDCGGRLLEESDLPNLPYLHCIINETMRLYPVGPVLVPHESSEEFTISGFTVPRGTMLLPNVWAVHRDPNAWDEPTLFWPERFEGEGGGSGGDLKEDSYNYKFLPFGLGRRSCPGAAMATRIIGLALGVLIQCFEWERVGPEEVGMDEEPTGLTLRKAKPLDAMYKPRESMIGVLSQL